MKNIITEIESSEDRLNSPKEMTEERVTELEDRIASTRFEHRKRFTENVILPIYFHVFT